MKRTITSRALEVPQQVHDGVVVHAALHHRVHLDRARPTSRALSMASSTVLTLESAAVHQPEHLVVQAVQAHGDALQAGVAQALRLLSQQVAVCGERQVLDAVDGRKHGHQLIEARSHQRLAAGQSNLLGAKAHEDANEPRDLLEGEEVSPGKELIPLAVDLGGHAVRAAEVAPVRDGDAQVPQESAEDVTDDGRLLGARPVLLVVRGGLAPCFVTAAHAFTPASRQAPARPYSSRASGLPRNSAAFRVACPRWLIMFFSSSSSSAMCLSRDGM